MYVLVSTRTRTITMTPKKLVQDSDPIPHTPYRITLCSFCILLNGECYRLCLHYAVVTKYLMHAVLSCVSCTPRPLSKPQ